MRKVELNPMEQFKYEIIKSLVTHNGNKLNASLKLGLSIRQINRLIFIYKQKGKEGFIHGNKNRAPSSTLSKEIKDTIVKLYQSKYLNFNFKHFMQMLVENEGIKISYQALYTLLEKYLIFISQSREGY